MKPEQIVAAVEPWVPPKLLDQARELRAAALRWRHGRDKLQRNAELRGTLAGQRAFIIGNGTSLRSVDLRKLRDENVFTVNHFFEHSAAYGLRPVAHVLIDPFYFQEPYATLKAFAKVRDPATMCLVPLEHERVARQHVGDVHCLQMSGTHETNPNHDLTAPVASLQTVTLAALLTSLHMGASPVYLVGCDMDMLSHVVDVSPLRVRQRHFYDAEERIVEDRRFDYPGYVHAILRMLRGYQFIHQRLEPGQRVLNAGVGGLLDTFERVEFESLFR